MPEISERRTDDLRVDLAFCDWYLWVCEFGLQLGVKAHEGEPPLEDRISKMKQAKMIIESELKKREEVTA